MISISFEQFYKMEYPEDTYQLYVVKNGTLCLYIGISRRGIWNRWFGFLGRMRKTEYGRWLGHDSIAMEIIDNLPDSFNYRIELYTLKDCKRFLRNEVKSSKYHPARIDIDACEVWMIHRLKPCLNVHYN